MNRERSVLSSTTFYTDTLLHTLSASQRIISRAVANVAEVGAEMFLRMNIGTVTQTPTSHGSRRERGQCVCVVWFGILLTLGKKERERELRFHEISSW